MQTWFALATASLALSCVRLDGSHCANLQGDATCALRDAARAHCSACVAEHDGCVADPVEAECVPTFDGSSSTADDDGDDPTTASDPTADDGVSSTPTTVDVSATSATEDDGDGSTSSDPATTSSDDGSSADGTSESTESTESTDGGSVCGNGIREGDEQCDGDDLDGMTCLEHPEFSSGTMGCDQFCVFNTTQCVDCLNLIGGCTLDEQCCSGQHCNLGLCIL